MEATNPYAPSVVDVEHAESANEHFDLDFGSILKRWEKLRIVYNLVLIPWTIALLFFSNAHPATVLLLPVAAIAANVLYLLGPVTEAYLTWFGFWRFWMTVVLFLAGLAFTGVAAAGVLLRN